MVGSHFWLPVEKLPAMPAYQQQALTSLPPERHPPQPLMQLVPSDPKMSPVFLRQKIKDKKELFRRATFENPKMPSMLHARLGIQSFNLRRQGQTALNYAKHVSITSGACVACEKVDK